MSKTFNFSPSEAHLYPSSGASGASLPDAAASGALGLVHSSTSDTRLHVDPVKARLKRLKRGVLTGARLHTEQATEGGFRFYPVMLTLTYRDGLPWSPLHVSDLMKHVRQWMGRRGFPARYVWVMELHQSGLPHYHVIFWLPKGISLPKPDKQGWWPHGMTRIERARNAVGYVAKYASKGDTGRSFPQGARIHACGVWIRPDVTSAHGGCVLHGFGIGGQIRPICHEFVRAAAGILWPLANLKSPLIWFPFFMARYG